MSSRSEQSHVARRGFVARLSAAAAGLTAFVGLPDRLRAAATTTQSPSNQNDPDAWIDRLTGKDRLLLHVHKDLLPGLVAARNVLGHGREFYGVPERDSSVVVATHGPAIGGMFKDVMWQQFTLGERYKLKDPTTGAPYTRNPFLTPQEGSPPDAVVPGLMQRGVMFLVCNIAIRNLSRRIVRAGESPEPLHKELAAGLLPGIVVVPDLFVAISHAQKKGVGYLFID